MSNGIAHNNLNDISKIYLDTISDINKKEQADDVKRWQQEESECGQNTRQQSPFKKKKVKAYKEAFSNWREDAQSDALAQMMGDGGDPQEDAIKQVVRAEKKAAKKKKVKKEEFSDWRTDLREVTSDAEATEIDNQPEIKEKKVKNKIKINPEFKEAVKQMGGELLEVKEVDSPDGETKEKEKPVVDKKAEQDDAKAKKIADKEKKLKLRILRVKMMAAKQDAGASIVAGYEPDIDGAVEYFYEEGINEEGIDQLVEEIGLESFVDFVDESAVELNEERAARRATVRAKKYDVVKKEVDKADAARKKSKKGEYSAAYKKKETDVTVYDDKPSAKKKAPVKKAPVKKSKKDYDGDKKLETPKQEHRGVRNKKITKAVAKVKKTQPKKKATKQGLGDKIRSAYKAGVKRHRKATQGARVFGKGAKSGAKKAVKFIKDVHKTVSEAKEAEKKKGRHPRDQAELDRAQEYIKKNPNFGKKNVKEEEIPRGPGGKPIRIKDKIRAAKGHISNEGKPTAEGYEETKKGEVLSAFKRDPKVRKRFEKSAKKEGGPGSAKNRAADDMLQTAKNIAKRKGDTSKSDDRYAYEGYQRDPEQSKKDRTHSKQPDPSKDGFTGIGNMSIKDIMKMNAKMKKKKEMKEDKALAAVRASIIKKHGKGAIYDQKKKQSPEDKAKVAAERKKRQDADNKAYAGRAKKAGFKSTQDYTNVVARYGSEDNYKKGKGLGT